MFPLFGEFRSHKAKSKNVLEKYERSGERNGVKSKRKCSWTAKKDRMDFIIVKPYLIAHTGKGAGKRIQLVLNPSEKHYKNISKHFGFARMLNIESFTQ